MRASTESRGRPFIARVFTLTPPWWGRAALLTALTVAYAALLTPTLLGTVTNTVLSLCTSPAAGGGWEEPRSYETPAVRGSLYVFEVRGPGWTARTIEIAPIGPLHARDLPTLPPPPGLYALWLARMEAGDRDTAAVMVEGGKAAPRDWARGVLADLASREAAGQPVPGVAGVKQIETTDRPWARAVSFALAFLPALVLPTMATVAVSRSLKRARHRRNLARISRGLCPRCGSAADGPTSDTPCPECGANRGAIRQVAERALGTSGARPEHSTPP